MSKLIDTDDFSIKLRNKAIDVSAQKLLITNYRGSDQEKDLTDPPNCDGFGRIRHFKLKSSNEWPTNPLPIVPAAKALNKEVSPEIRAQIFQNAICNWRCWYCFVDFKLLSGNTKHSSFLSTDQLVDMYLSEENRPQIIDLSGGQPDLTPEWVPWMMQSLKDRQLETNTFLWSDDNLSNDYFWKFLSDDQIDTICKYKMYGRVCCFKGFDEDSFSLNTKAEPVLFGRQFDLFERIYRLKLNLYGYITLTTPTSSDVANGIPKFFDRIQKINESLILRIVPLEVFAFGAVQHRVKEVESDLLKGQYKAIEVWRNELAKRFSSSHLKKQVIDINIY